MLLAASVLEQTAPLQHLWWRGKEDGGGKKLNSDGSFHISEFLKTSCGMVGRVCQGQKLATSPLHLWLLASARKRALLLQGQAGGGGPPCQHANMHVALEHLVLRCYGGLEGYQWRGADGSPLWQVVSEGAPSERFGHLSTNPQAPGPGPVEREALGVHLRLPTVLCW